MFFDTKRGDKGLTRKNGTLVTGRCWNKLEAFTFYTQVPPGSPKVMIQGRATRLRRGADLCVSHMARRKRIDVIRGSVVSRPVPQAVLFRATAVNTLPGWFRCLMWRTFK